MAKGLGKLSQLFTDDDEGDFDLPDISVGGSTSEVPISQVFPNPNQPRKVFDENAMNDLANSIREHGVISPIVVNKNADGTYMIIAGERRYRASVRAGLERVPVIVKNYDEREILEVSLIENLQREDLNPIEAAFGMKKLM